jgi:mannose-6-phosphate isomerase-like protein (cupin superfamily)
VLDSFFEGTQMIVTEFSSKALPAAPDAIAPDGFEVRWLQRLPRGSVAHFQLAGGGTSRAVTHRTVEEIWVFLGGRGEMWRKQGAREETIQVEAGTSITIPLGTHFQCRSFGPEPLADVAVTMPPWPGDDEARQVPGAWAVRT